MSYCNLNQDVTLNIETDVTHQCALHYTRDKHLIGIISFSKPSYSLQWGDLEYFRRRVDEFSVMLFPECIGAMIIDIRHVNCFLDGEAPILPWRLMEEECPIRIVVNEERLEYYAGFFEATWLTTNQNHAIQELRDFMDALVH